MAVLVINRTIRGKTQIAYRCQGSAKQIQQQNPFVFLIIRYETFDKLCVTDSQNIPSFLIATLKNFGQLKNDSRFPIAHSWSFTEISFIN
jgi:hypothetical protein